MDESQNRRVRLLKVLRAGASKPLIKRLCDLAVTQVPVDGAVIGLEIGGIPDGPLASSGDWALGVANAEYALGEGPTFDMALHGRHIEVSRSDSPELERWPNFSKVLSSAKVGSIFCFPLHLGGARLGALSLMRVAEEELEEDQYLNCLAISDLATNALIYVQAGLADGEFEDLLVSSDPDRLRIHQATGMVAAMLNCSIEDAIARLRAHAFAEEMTLYDLAKQVVDREIRFDSL